MPSINLLPWRQALRQRRQKEFLTGLGAAAVVAALVALLAHLTVGSMIDSQQRRNELLKTEIAELDKAIAEIDQLEDQKARMISRMEVIDRLQASRPEIVKMFDEMVGTLPEGVYLTGVKQSGRRLELNGVAQSSTRVSTLMRNIDSSETLAAPELKVIQSGRDGEPGSQFTMFSKLRAEDPQEQSGGETGPKRVREASR